MDVQIANYQKSIVLDPVVWQERLSAWMDRLGLPPHAHLSVTLTDNKEIARVNRVHRGLDRATDVLAFPAPRDFPAAPGGPVPLGDILVSVERAQAQSQEYDHSFDRELGFLLSHGLLHLLGYDHVTPAQELTMRTRQEELLAAVGLNREP